MQGKSKSTFALQEKTYKSCHAQTYAYLINYITKKLARV